jgi:hypothetical protein
VSDPLPPSAALPLTRRGRRERSERGGRSHIILVKQHGFQRSYTLSPLRGYRSYTFARLKSPPFTIDTWDGLM